MTTLPHMIANVGEILDIEDDVNDAKEGSGFVQKKAPDEKKTNKALIIKTSGRHTMYLPSFGLVEPGELKPGDMIGVNKESFMVYDKLPAEYDSRVKAMEVDERPTEEYSDIGGLDKQIEELVEAIVLPMTQSE
jgi:26S proteasome regulatory subunit T5